MSRRTVILAAAALLSAVGLGCALYFLVFPALFPRTPGIDVDALTASLDQDLAGGYLVAVRAELSDLGRLPGAETDLMRILKRAYRLGAAGGDWATLEALAARALRARPASPPIRTVAAYAALRAGRVAAAEKALAGGRVEREAGDLLRGETALRQGRSWPGVDPLTSRLAGLEASGDPAQFTAAAADTGDARLLLDAALLAMGRGSGDIAHGIVSSGLAGSRWNEPAAMILYDTGDSAGALERLQRMKPYGSARADLDLLEGDLLVSLGRLPEASTAIEHALAIRPEMSWIPYADLAWLAMQRGDSGAARSTIETGLRVLGTGARELTIRLAGIEAGSGDDTSAEQLLSTLLSKTPGDVEASRELLRLQAPGLSLEAYRARLWKLFSANPTAPEVLGDLVQALVGSEDWAGIQLALKQYEAAGGDVSAGSLLAAGMAAAMRGDGAGAVRLFNRAAAMSPDGIPRYDAALVMLSQGRADAALQQLALAEEESARAGSSGGGDAFAARVQEARAEAFLLLGNRAAARTALDQARRLDPHSLRVTLLSQKLEAPAR